MHPVTPNTRMLGLILSPLLALAASATEAATADWPSTTAPCNGTLQACIDGTTVPATIRVLATAPTITGTILLSDNQSLVAGPNARPKIQNGQIQISVGGATPGNASNTVDNFILENSQIYLIIGSTVSTELQKVFLNRLKIVNTTTTPAVFVASGAGASGKYVSLRGSSIEAPQILRSAVGFQSQNLGMDIDDNILRPTGSALAGVQWTTMNANSLLRLRRNRFEGQNGTPGKAIEVGTPDFPAETVLAQAWIERNVFVGMPQPIQINDNAGRLQVEVRNNSLTRFNTGIGALRGGPGTLTLNVANNLITQGVQAMSVSPSATSFPELTRSRNLYDAVGTPSFGLEANAVLGNPLTRSSSNLRISGFGPALDSADPTQMAMQSPTDFDRVYGSRGNGPDIGAFEWTDTVSNAFTSNSSNIVSNTARIPSTMLSTTRNHIGFVQRIVSGNGLPLPTNANKHLGIYLSSTDFRLFTEDLSPFPASSFRILKTTTTAYSRDFTLVHQAISQAGNPANNVSFAQTNIPASVIPTSLGSFDGLIPQVTQRWNPPGSSGTYNNRAVGIYRYGSSFAVFNQDITAMPHGAGFHVLMPAQLAAYTQRIRSSVAAPTLALTHDLLTDNACAHVYVTANFGDPQFPSAGSAYVPSTILTRYDNRPDGGGQWSAVRGDGLNFAAGTVLNVYVDPEVANQCREASF